MGDYYFPAFFVIGSLAVIAFVVFCCIRRRQQRQQEGQPVQFNSYTSPYGAGNYSQPSTGTDPIYMDNNVRYGALQSTALYPPPPSSNKEAYTNEEIAAF